MINSFWRTYSSLFLSFVAFRLMLQTDLLMLAPLGEEAITAFALPQRLMFFDTVFAYAIGPVAAVTMSQTAASDRSLVAAQFLSWSMTAGVFLTAFGLITYPAVLSWIAPQGSVQTMASDGIFWLTVTISIRIVVFVGAMLLFAAAFRRPVLAMYLLSLGLNVLFNWLFIYRLKFGFEGAYIATALVACFEFMWVVHVCRKHLKARLLTAPSMIWLRKVYAKIGAEWGRLLSWQAETLAVVALLTYLASSPAPFAAFSVVTELLALLTMPLIALMRTVAIVESKGGAGSTAFVGSLRANKGLYGIFLGTYVVIAAVLFVLAEPIGRDAYRLSGASLGWWTTFASIFLIALPVFVLGNVLRGVVQANGEFSAMAKADVSVTWLLFLPMVLIGVVKNNAHVFFSAFLLKEICADGLLLWLVHRKRKTDCVIEQVVT
jgi:Na+-driven multidrug efflux pump